MIKKQTSQFFKIIHVEISILETSPEFFHGLKRLSQRWWVGDFPNFPWEVGPMLLLMVQKFCTTLGYNTS